MVQQEGTSWGVLSLPNFSMDRELGSLDKRCSKSVHTSVSVLVVSCSGGHTSKQSKKFESILLPSGYIKMAIFSLVLMSTTTKLKEAITILKTEVDLENRFVRVHRGSLLPGPPYHDSVSHYLSFP